MSALGMLAALLWLAAPGVRGVRRDEPPAPPSVAGAAALAAGGREGAAVRAEADGPRFSHDPSDVRT
jgi:hypothetical protein